MSVEKSENKFILPVGRSMRDVTAVSVVVVRAAPDRRHGARDSVSTPHCTVGRHASCLNTRGTPTPVPPGASRLLQRRLLGSP
ncbi:unnamed protein product [Boreogadus saida]